jgi:prophage tail gpP-like protein
MQYERDSKGHYGSIIITGQSSEDSVFNIEKRVVDITAPIKKTIVVERDINKSLTQYANQLIEQQKFNSKQITYTVSGFSQNSIVFDINKFCTVMDNFANINDTLLVYGVVFSLSKTNGFKTELQLSYPGVFA